MTTRPFTALIFLLLLLRVSAPPREIFAADRPNILLLLSDDHSYPFVSAYGDSNVNTPTLDRLAADHDLARVTIEDLVAYRRAILRPGVRVSVVT